MKKNSSLFSQSFFLSAFIVVFYGVSNLWNLTALPVFADEAIYIRWAQLIIDDAKQYAFFPLNDGKTPLFIWLTAAVQFLFTNQLFAGRFLSVVVGGVQLLVIKKVIQELGGRRMAQFLGMFFVTILPYWYFYHRMALMDSMLALFLSLSMYGAVRISKTSLHKEVGEYHPFWQLLNPRSYLHIFQEPTIFGLSIFTGVMFGLGLWTKLPALFFAPAFPLFVLLNEKESWQERIWKLIPLGGSVVLGLAMFAAMKLHPAFGQLFSRGRDFTYPVSEVLLGGKWRETVISIPNYISYFVSYLSLPVVLLSLAGLFSNAARRKTVILLLCTVIFCAPFALFGKVVFARYLLPAAVFITISSVLSLQALYDRYFVRTRENNLVKQLIVGVIITFAVSTTVTQSATFMLYAALAPNKTPFIPSDQVQYLTEWSSGHGIAETAEYIRNQAKTKRIAVATEGRFGTLPDGLLMYFHRQNVENIYIEGTGQYPLKFLPDFFLKKARDFDQVIVVANSHRMEMALPEEKRIGRFCRPYNAPCLEVWDVTDIAKKAASP